MHKVTNQIFDFKLKQSVLTMKKTELFTEISVRKHIFHKNEHRETQYTNKRFQSKINK